MEDTREIYLKIKKESDLSFAIVGYVYKDDKGTIQIGKTLNLDFRESTIKNIMRMKAIEKVAPKFLFWNNSEEGKAFFKENGKEIGKTMANIIINQK